MRVDTSSKLEMGDANALRFVDEKNIAFGTLLKRVVMGAYLVTHHTLHECRRKY
jgi:hypothetical protein